MQGFILSSYNWFYPFLQIPGGYLADIYGAKRVLAFVGGCVGTLTLLVPIGVTYGDFYAMITIRGLSGLLEVIDIIDIFVLSQTLQLSEIIIFRG